MPDTVSGGVPVSFAFALTRTKLDGGTLVKSILLLWFASHCLAIHGQPAKPPAPAKVYENYQQILRKSAGLESKLAGLEQAYRKDQRALALKFRAGKLTPQKAAAKERALAVARQKKETALRKDAAALESQRLDFERRYAVPVLSPVKPALATPPTR